MAEQNGAQYAEARQWHLKGAAAYKCGDFATAAEHFAKVVAIDPDSVSALSNLGTMLRVQGKFAEAKEPYRHATELQPDNPKLLYEFGALHHALGELDEAQQLYQKALALDDQFLEALVNMGKLLCEQNFHHAAKPYLQKAIAVNANHADAYAMLARVKSELGEMDASMADYRKAIECDPLCVEGYYQIALKLRESMPAVEIAAMRQLLQEPSLAPAKQFKLHYGLGSIFDGKSEYHVAADHFQAAGKIQKRFLARHGRKYHPGGQRRFINNMIEHLNAAFFERTRVAGLDSTTAVFIVGLPRSGTTLTEQILASHPQIYGAGELRFARNAFMALPVKIGKPELSPVLALKQIDSAALNQIAQEYLAQLRKINSESTHIVDKMPENYLALGLIAAILPKAKIIHCRRNLRDTALSCWMTAFELLPWTCDVEHIKSHIQCYLDLMSHWRKVLPTSILEIDYEETVENTEEVAKRLIHFLDLEWDPACAQFHKTDRPIQTASVNQVRKPVYKSSVGRWQHYEGIIPELLKIDLTHSP